MSDSMPSDPIEQIQAATPDADTIRVKLLGEAASHERWYPSDTLHGLLRDAASSIASLTASLAQSENENVARQVTIDNLRAENERLRNRLTIERTSGTSLGGPYVRLSVTLDPDEYQRLKMTRQEFATLLGDQIASELEAAAASRTTDEGRGES